MRKIILPTLLLLLASCDFGSMPLPAIIEHKEIQVATFYEAEDNYAIWVEGCNHAWYFSKDQFDKYNIGDTISANMIGGNK